jgi:hypothetical protein
MEEIRYRFDGQVEFFVVYVREAHPTDGWQTDSNVAEGILHRQHQSYEEREEVAATCSMDLHLSLPVLIEEMDNVIDDAYGAAPRETVPHRRRRSGRLSWRCRTSFLRSR